MHNAQYTLFALRALREDGWKLPREGLSSRVRHVIAVVVFFFWPLVRSLCMSSTHSN